MKRNPWLYRSSFQRVVRFTKRYRYRGPNLYKILLGLLAAFRKMAVRPLKKLWVVHKNPNNQP